ncbi:hypothetical protein Salat_0797500 [Sesamum alatum]|uniref:DUF4378 domain-containing protein n=1 Tax=Sesamum alatum TaxID=300844 RepID=A0AAE2CVU7_9LAMI|nr:hypothetical protein Salat_0797500 [Sesamum alatum]
MGRDWLQYWGGGGGGSGSGRPAASRRRRRRRMSAEMEEGEGSSAAGCMCAVLQLFDLHQFQIPLNNHDLFLPEEATLTKGVEAPRNSLEIEGPAAMKAASMPSSAMKKEENLNFPVGIQIKTRVSTSESGSRTEDFPSDSSPGIKTPNLVARLMGLDLLPESTSPSFSSSDSRPGKKSQFNQRKDRNVLQTRFFDDDISVGARSLPETPRISSARRSDVEFHRLSLQINKENTTNDEFSLSGKMAGRKGLRFRQQIQDENRSPGQYAKQIVKQIKESVSRRVGLDITNINRDKQEIRRDENLLLFKPTKRNSQNLPPVSNSGNKSPRISEGNFSPLKPKNQEIVQENQHQKESKRGGSGNSNSSSCLKKFPSHHQACDNPMIIRKKKEEPFVRSAAANKANLTDKKSKKTPLSSESCPSLLPVKKDPSPPATKLPQKQSQVSDALSSKRSTQLSSNPSHSYKQLHLQPHKISTVPENVLPDKTNGCATTSSATAAAVAEYKCYIQRILRRTGIIDKITPLTLGKWHTPSHPLDPSIFHYLELFHPTAAAAPIAAVLSRRCNRKLIFQLVDELLAEILRPHLDFKPWVAPITDHLSLVDELCKKIESFPAANCQVLEDIDSLIYKDLCKPRLNGFLEEEGESLVCEIEGEIMESLVRETVVIFGVRTAEERRKKPTDVTWRAFT